MEPKFLTPENRHVPDSIGQKCSLPRGIAQCWRGASEQVGVAAGSGEG